MGTTPATVSTALFWPFMHAIDGLPPPVQARALAQGQAVLEAAGHLVPELTDPRARIPHEDTLTLLQAVVDVSGDPAFGLHAGACAQRGDFGLFDMLLRSAPSLGESMRVAGRFIELLHDGAALELSEEGELAVWSHWLRPGVDGPCSANEYVLAAFFIGSQGALGFDAPPREVRFMHARPDHWAACEALFGAPVCYGCERNAIVVPRTALELPLVGNDGPLFSVLLQQAEVELTRLPRLRSFGTRVREVIAADVAGACHLSAVARALHVSESTVQRRLQAEATSHTALLDDVRREQALSLLGDPALNVSEVAYRLGFSHRPAFHRAFKRWYGSSPSEHRRRQARSPLYRFYGST